MVSTWTRQAAFYRNELAQCLTQLAGLATGLVADRELNDKEIRFLRQWLETHDTVIHQWPGDILKARIDAVLADGVVTEPERAHLLQTLDDLVGCRTETMDAAQHVSELAFDEVKHIAFAGHTFCLTGDFVYAPRAVCQDACEARGAVVQSGVSRNLHYLVVGSLGSPEWKYGSFGLKIEKAIELKRDGRPIRIVREDVWAAAL